MVWRRVHREDGIGGGREAQRRRGWAHARQAAPRHFVRCAVFGRKTEGAHDGRERRGEQRGATESADADPGWPSGTSVLAFRPCRPSVYTGGNQRVPQRRAQCCRFPPRRSRSRAARKGAAALAETRRPAGASGGGHSVWQERRKGTPRREAARARAYWEWRGHMRSRRGREPLSLLDDSARAHAPRGDWSDRDGQGAGATGAVGLGPWVPACWRWGSTLHDGGSCLGKKYIFY